MIYLGNIYMTDKLICDSCDIQMTASHLPYTRNGLKFFTPQGGLTSNQVEEICDRAARKYVKRLVRSSPSLKPLPPSRVDFMTTYADHLRNIIKTRVDHPLHYDTPLKGFHVLKYCLIFNISRPSSSFNLFISKKVELIAIALF